mmetsp:Transcript_19048/g.37385  ORF Transcript_19048/g.37385 Transcript_19048/m.37385 type:complete len:103 (-) Transcript_19048:88-396(-)
MHEVEKLIITGSTAERFKPPCGELIWNGHLLSMCMMKKKRLFETFFIVEKQHSRRILKIADIAAWNLMGFHSKTGQNIEFSKPLLLSYNVRTNRVEPIIKKN